MVDSSLRIADQVDTDAQSVKGDLWLMRACRWKYLPFRYRLAYHAIGDSVEIVYFQVQRIAPRFGPWVPVRTVDAYCKLLRRADYERLLQVSPKNVRSAE